MKLWKDFNPDQCAFIEQIVREETKDGVYSHDSHISVYVLGKEIRVYCKYAVNPDSKNEPGLMNVHGWTDGPAIDREYVENGWPVMAHDYFGKTGNREYFTQYPETLRYGNMDRPQGYR